MPCEDFHMFTEIEQVTSPRPAPIAVAVLSTLAASISELCSAPLLRTPQVAIQPWKG